MQIKIRKKNLDESYGDGRTQTANLIKRYSRMKNHYGSPWHGKSRIVRNCREIAPIPLDKGRCSVLNTAEGDAEKGGGAHEKCNLAPTFVILFRCVSLSRSLDSPICFRGYTRSTDRTRLSRQRNGARRQFHPAGNRRLLRTIGRSTICDLDLLRAGNSARSVDLEKSWPRLYFTKGKRRKIILSIPLRL